MLISFSTAQNATVAERNISCLLNDVAHRVRLANGPDPSTGRVEIYANSTGGLDNAEWGTICGDNWDIQNARVVCNQLGYPDAIDVLLAGYYGHGAGPVWLNSLKCLGNETDLFTCVHDGFGSHSCKDDQDVSVKCSGMIVICLIN